MAVYPWPCGCNTVVVTSSSSNCDDCIYVPDVILGQNENLLPCGAGGSPSDIDITSFPATKLTAATGTLIWALLESADEFDSDKFAEISINASGLITFKLSLTAKVGDIAYIIGRVRDTGTGLSSIFKIGVPVYNACMYINCDENETCNPCTANCDAISQDIIVG